MTSINARALALQVALGMPTNYRRIAMRNEAEAFGRSFTSRARVTYNSIVIERWQRRRRTLDQPSACATAFDRPL